MQGKTGANRARRIALAVAALLVVGIGSATASAETQQVGDPAALTISAPVAFDAPATFTLCSGTKCVSNSDIKKGVGTLTLSFSKDAGSISYQVLPCPAGKDGAAISLNGVPGATALNATFTPSDPTQQPQQLGPVNVDKSRAADTSVCTSGS